MCDSEIAIPFDSKIAIPLLGSFLTGGLIFGLVGYYAQVHNVAYTESIMDPAQCEALVLSVETSLENNKRIIGVLDGVLVTLSQGYSDIGSVTTNGNGQGRLCSPRGQLVLKAEKEGFNMDRVVITVKEGECRKTVKLSLSALLTTTTTTTTTTTRTTGPCEVKLTVKTANAINNNAIGGVLVTLLQYGSTVNQVTTDSSGQGHMTSPRGQGFSQLLLKAELEGFTMAPVTLTVGEEECEKTIELSLSPETSDPARVVMNWVHDPKDLDLHVKQLRGGSEVCHCCHQHKRCYGFALDVDNTNYGENGAETITWTESDQSSQYLVFVLDYSGAATHISQSGARIALYNEGQDPRTINVPANGSSNRYWKVGCFNSTGFTLINQIVSREPNSC